MVAVAEDRRRTEVLRVLHRYLVEVVEEFDLCPWARVARERGEVGFDVVWGTPTAAECAAPAKALLEAGSQVVMIIMPELVIDSIDLHDLRNEVTTLIPSAGVAEFHPDAKLDLATPARLVSYIRRSPDPLLQLVPLSLLASVRGGNPGADRLHQAQIQSGTAAPPKRDAAERIAAANHVTVSAAHETITRTLADIAADRQRSYERVGINVSR